MGVINFCKKIIAFFINFLVVISKAMILSCSKYNQRTLRKKKRISKFCMGLIKPSMTFWAGLGWRGKCEIHNRLIL